MQGEDDLRGLAKIMAFMRAVSILLVLMHLYWFCNLTLASYTQN
nr:YWFCY domain-containing protein [Olivibacter sp. XZL3]